MKIHIEHISKIEGHAGFIADIADGRIQKVRVEILEGARLLEGILRDRDIYEATQISARICGVCPVVHTLAGLKAIEKALEIEISPRTHLLRQIMMMGQIINSHSLHLFFFSLPDFLKVANDLELIKKQPQRAKEALAVREFGNRLVAVIGGRSIHPITPTVGGFRRLPQRPELEKLLALSVNVLADAKRLAEVFINLTYPDFIRPAPFVSLSHASQYAFYDGHLKTSDGHQSPPANFINLIKESQLENSVVKRAQYNGKPFMVGAISRLNNNHTQLNPLAKALLKKAKIHLPSLNPFHNILAQAIETVHCVEEAQKLLKKALRISLENNDIQEQNDLVKTRLNLIKTTAQGVGAVEAPRGTLYYFYEFKPDGKIENCNIITPTSQNMARLERDLEEYLPDLLGHSLKGPCDKECQAKIKTLVRAYDPCLTCAAH